MGDLINGRTPEEIKRWISSRTTCNTCPKEHETGCEYGERTEDCQMCIDTIAYIEHLEARQPKWIGVKERLPPPETKIYLIASNDPNGERIVKTSVWAWDENSKKGDWINWNVVTHWMPLPEPPEEE